MKLCRQTTLQTNKKLEEKAAIKTHIYDLSIPMYNVFTSLEILHLGR